MRVLKRWRVYGRSAQYVYWTDGEVYQATVDDTPPGFEDGGYYNLRSLRRLKGDDSELKLDL